MKKEVQALINRRRARMVPVLLAGLAGIIVLVFVVFVVDFFVNGPGQMVLRGTPTPTLTLTHTPLPPTTTPPATGTPTLTPLPTVTAGPSPTPTVLVYVVQQYDTLFDISVKFKVDIESIKLANKMTGDVLSVGQKLVIPPQLPTTTPSPIPSGLPRGAQIQYKVILGDTLESIAAQFNSRTDDIIKANPDPNNPKNKLSNGTLRVGMVIKVPINLVTPVPSATPKP
jgi:LysM repeat protein